MNYGRLIKKGTFSAGFGYGMGLTVGLIGGAMIVGGSVAAAFGGYFAVKKYLRKRKKAKTISNIVIDNTDSEMEDILS